MAWAKAWHDTRWRFAILLAVLLALTCYHVFEWREVRTLVSAIDPSVAGANAALREAVAEAIAAQQTFRGYIWHQWFDQNFASCIVLFAGLLGSGSALSGSGRGLLFSLALQRRTLSLRPPDVVIDHRTFDDRPAGANYRQPTVP